MTANRYGDKVSSGEAVNCRERMETDRSEQQPYEVAARQLWFALMSSIPELQAFEKCIRQPFELL